MECQVLFSPKNNDKKVECCLLQFCPALVPLKWLVIVFVATALASRNIIGIIVRRHGWRQHQQCIQCLVCAFSSNVKSVHLLASVAVKPQHKQMKYFLQSFFPSC